MSAAALGTWQTCPDCLHPGWAHPRADDPPARSCIGENCECRRRARGWRPRGEMKPS